MDPRVPSLHCPSAIAIHGSVSVRCRRCRGQRPAGAQIRRRSRPSSTEAERSGGAFGRRRDEDLTIRMMSWMWQSDRGLVGCPDGYSRWVWRRKGFSAQLSSLVRPQTHPTKTVCSSGRSEFTAVLVSQRKESVSDRDWTCSDDRWTPSRPVRSSGVQWAPVSTSTCFFFNGVMYGYVPFSKVLEVGSRYISIHDPWDWNRTAAPDRAQVNHPWPDRQSYGSPMECLG